MGYRRLFIMRKDLGMSHGTEALDIIRDDPAENAAMLRRTTSTSQNAIEFKNGSVLWFTPEEVLPRLRCPMIDEGLYDTKIKEDFIREYIVPMERRKDI